jgi:predicted  nucleic acid-binding Zn-ribbon protein
MMLFMLTAYFTFVLYYESKMRGELFMESNKGCPICGCKQIGKGKQYAQAKMFPIHKSFSMGSEIIAEICTECGHILSMRVKSPEKFK